MASMIPHRLAHLSARIFNTPLMMRREKIDSVLHVLSARLDLSPGAVPIVAVEAPEKRATISEYTVELAGKPGAKKATIAVIPVVGPLVKRDSGDAISGGPTTYGEIRGCFRDALADPNCKGILLDIDSPGGEVSGLFELADEIAAARGQKPIYAVANDDCFSAAYALGCAADRLYVTQTGGCGSIGVVALHCDQSGFDEKMGVFYTYIFDGDKKVDLNPHEPLADSAKADLKAEISRLGNLFRSMVAKNRSISADSIKSMQAGLYFGADAVTAGLADTVGTFDQALDDLAALVGGNTSFGSSVTASAATIQTEEQEMAQVSATAEATELSLAAKPVDDDEEFPGEDQIDPNEDDEEEKKPMADEIMQAAAATPVKAAASMEEIVDLCELAGQPLSVAKELHSKKLNMSGVREELLAMRRVKETPIQGISTLGKPGALTALETAAANLAATGNTTKEKAYTQLLARNPHAYIEYLAGRPGANTDYLRSLLQ